MNIIERCMDAIHGIDQRLCELSPVYAKLEDWLHKKVDPIKTAASTFFSFLAFMHVFFYQHLKDGFGEFMAKMQTLSSMASGSDFSDMAAVGFIEKIEVANAIFPIDHLLNCIIFILSAWVIALELKFVFFVIRLIKP